MNKPIRMCVSCRKRAEKDNFIRISSQNNIAAIDQNKTNASRAIYVCKEEKCINILKKSNAIQRTLKTQVENNFYDKLTKLV